MESSYELTKCGAAVVLLCAYGVFMFLHVVAILFGRRWFYSRVGSFGAPPPSEVAVSAAGRCDTGLDGGSGWQHQDGVGVSIIKPVIGFDRNLRTNLESFFQLDYPNFEILFCIGESHNAPSLPVVNELMALYPSVNVRIFKGGEMVGVNPKINNMLPAYKSAKFDLLWICDSSILGPLLTISQYSHSLNSWEIERGPGDETRLRSCVIVPSSPRPDSLWELTSHIVSNPQVALVHQLPYTAPTDDSLAGYLDKVYFGTQHSRVYILASIKGENCANGMSWLVRRHAIEREGGLLAFSGYLAEDFYMGKALWKKGWKFVLSTLPARQNPGVRSFSSYRSRIIRWGRLRTTMMPWPGLLEPFTECLCLGAIGALCSSYLFSVSVPLFLLLHTALWFCFDLLLIRTIEGGPVGSVWKIFCVWCIRELWTFPLFVAGVWSREVSWKGQRYKLQFGGKATKLD